MITPAPGASAALVDALARGADVPGLAIRAFAPLPEGPLHERTITVDQTNTSVIVGERVVVKWMREPASLARAPDLLEHLAVTGFAETPASYAAAYRDGMLIAIITAYLPEARDGWDWCVDALIGHLRDGTPADFAAQLGELVGRLHCALATPSRVFPTAIVEIPNPGWASCGRAVLDEARELAAAAGDEDGRWFLDHAGRFAAEIEACADVENVQAIHPHGDLHVGQILRWREGCAVTDFDGNPTLAGPAMEPAARDIAQLRTSLLHVGEIADRRTEGRHRRAVGEWAGRSVDDLMSAYRRILETSGKGDILDERLLRAFEVEQECRELLYAAKFLPRWRYAPMGVLRSWYE